MSEKQNQNSNIIFDGSNLKMTSDGPKYDKDKKVSMAEALTKVSGGKKYNNLRSALEDVKKGLKFNGRD